VNQVFATDKSCLAQEENYLLRLYRYIELNTRRAWGKPAAR